MPDSSELLTADALLDWLSTNTRLDLSHYSPTYGDDSDQAVEWRVHEARGNINDREWRLVGAGETPLLALKAAFLTKEHE